MSFSATLHFKGKAPSKATKHKPKPPITSRTYASTIELRVSMWTVSNECMRTLNINSQKNTGVCISHSKPASKDELTTAKAYNTRSLHSPSQVTHSYNSFSDTPSRAQSKTDTPVQTPKHSELSLSQPQTYTGYDWISKFKNQETTPQPKETQELTKSSNVAHSYSKTNLNAKLRTSPDQF